MVMHSVTSVYVSVCVCVCPVRALTFESPDLKNFTFSVQSRIQNI